MKLLRLLAAGRSLIGVKQSDCRYRPAPAKSLPVFESAPNPYRATATPQSGLSSEHLLKPALEPLSGVVEPAGGSSPVQDHVSSVPSEAAPLRACESRESKGAARDTNGRDRWFRWRPFGKPADTSAVPPVPRAVQGELSLDNVKPVRNDLGDSDFEVVPVKRTTVEKTGKKRVPVTSGANPAPADAGSREGGGTGPRHSSTELSKAVLSASAE